MTDAANGSPSGDPTPPERPHNTGAKAENPEALCRTRTGDPFLTIERQTSDPVSSGPRNSEIAPESTGRNPGEDPAAPDRTDANAPGTPPEERLWSIGDLARHCQCSTKTIRRAIDRGDLETVTAAPAARAATGDHWVYLARDAAGRLLYVGITWRGVRRITEHAATEAWATHVATIEVEHHATRQEAETRERDLIHSERPLFNIAHRGQVRITQSAVDAWKHRSSNQAGAA